MNTVDGQRPNPFPGLRPFRSDEHHQFFGREEQTAALLQLLRTNRFLAVVGTSGSGKSSLVRAGMIAELHGGTMTQAGSTWEVVILRPGGSPIENLARAMVEANLYDAADPSTVPRLLATLNRSRFGLVEAMKQSEMFVRAGSVSDGPAQPSLTLPARTETNLLVVVDQFEELFRFRQQGVDSEETAAAFVNLLLTASEQTERPIYVTITMRSDYLGDCSEIPGLAEAVNEGEYLIPRLQRDQKRDAIEKPIGVGGAKISPLLVQRLLNEVGDDPDQLPVLQHALMRMWDAWSARGDHHRPIEFGDLEATGGLASALSNHADEIYAGLPDDRHQSVCEKIFKTLTEKGDDNRGIRRPTRLARLQAIAAADRATVTAVLDAFRGSGVTFLMPGMEAELEDRTVIDLSHESLMRGWQRLRGWVEEEAQSARIFRRLLDTARLWSDGKAGLFRDPDLQIALSWRAQDAPNAGWAEQYGGDLETAIGFLVTSDAEAEAEQQAKEAARQRELAQAQELAESRRQRLLQQQRSAARLRAMLAGLGVVAAIAVVTSIVAGKFWQAANVAKLLAEESEATAQDEAIRANELKSLAEENEKEATEQRDQAKQTRNAAARQAAGLLLDRGIEDARAGEPARALHLFVQALRTLPTDDPQAAPLERVIRANLTSWAETVPALEHIWPGGPKYTNIAFTPDGERIAMAVGKDEVQCFRTDTGRPVGPPAELPDGVGEAMAFAADGRSLWVASPGKAKVVEQWALHRLDPASGRPIQRPIPTPGPLYSLAVTSLGVTPDGRYLVGVVLGLHPEDRGPRVSAAGERKWRTASIVVWETASGRVVRNVDVNAESVFSLVGLAPDGKSVTAWIHRGSRYEGLTFGVYGNEPPKSLGPHPYGNITSFTNFNESYFSPLHFQRNMRTALAIKDGQVHRWSVTNPGVLGPGVPTPFPSMHNGPSVDGRSIISPIDGRVFDTGAWPPRPSGVRFAHPGWQRDVGAFEEQSPDGRFTATWTTGGEGDRRLWLLPRPHSRPPLPRAEFARQPERKDYYRLAQFDPRGTAAILWSPPQSDDNQNVRLLDVATGAVRVTSVRHSGLVRDVVFTPDGRYFATASFDATARVWETATGRPAGPPLLHTNYVAAVAFTPDGNTLAAGDYGPAGLIKLWNWRTGKEVRPPLRHDDIILNVSFSPDGQYLAALKAPDWSKNPELLVWEVASGKAVMRKRHTCPGYLIREAARFRPDGRAVVARDTNGVLHLWEVPSGKLLGERPLDGDGVTRFSPDGRAIAASANLGVRLLNADTLAPLPGGYLPHADPIQDLAFSPDGAFLLTGHETGSAQLWDVATRKPVGPPAVLIGPIRAVTFTPDGKTCVCVAADGTVRRWPVPAPNALPDLDRLADRVVLMTGQRMETNQGLDSVPADEWRALRAKLIGDGSTALVPPRADADWHDTVAADAEQDGDAIGAEWHLDRLAALRPDDWTIPARRGRLLAGAGQRDKAAAAYAAARALAPSPRDLADWLRAAAADDEAAKRYDEGLWSLDRAVEITPDDWVPYAARAALADQAGLHDRAGADIDAAIRLGAESTVIVQAAERAVARATQTSDWIRVATFLKTAAKDSNLPLDDRYHLAVACVKAGDRTGYRAACTGIAERMPPAETPLQFGDALAAATAFALGSGATDDWSLPLSWAERVLTRYAQREAADPSLKERFKSGKYLFLHARGSLQYRAGKFEQAVKVLREGMSLNANGGEVSDWVFLALAEHRLGHADTAKQAATKARAVKAAAKPDAGWAGAEFELLSAELDASLPPISENDKK